MGPDTSDFRVSELQIPDAVADPSVSEVVDPAGVPDDASESRVALLRNRVPGVRLNGAWWPRTDDLVLEVPGLIDALDRLGETITRVSYHRGDWSTAPRRMISNGRIVHLDGFDEIEPHEVSVNGIDTGQRLDLLVVAPATAAVVAASLMDLTALTIEHGSGGHRITEAEAAAAP